MADQKISQLTLAAPDDTDVIPFIDISDTTMGTGGTTKKATKTDLKGDQGIQGIQGIQGVQGLKGDKGDTGNAATATAGTTTTGLAGTDASVVNSGSTSAAVFDFTIPRGETGLQGEQGETGPQGIQGIPGLDGDGAGSVTSVSVTTANGVSGSVATETTTPAITLTLGAITPSSVNGLELSASAVDFNTKVGYQAGYRLVEGARYNTYLGHQAGISGATTDDTADSNTGIGALVMSANTTGANNTCIGLQSLSVNTTGNGNSAIGNRSLFANTTGSSNTALGNAALLSNQTGGNNVALGAHAGRYETGSDSFYVDSRDRTNTAGDKAGALLYGTFNATPASQTLTVNATLTVAQNIALGADANTTRYVGTSGTRTMMGLDATGGFAVLQGGVSKGVRLIVGSGTFGDASAVGLEIAAADKAATFAGTVSATGLLTSGTLELGHATDTTLSRVSAGVIAVEGVTIPTISSTSTLTNKRITQRVVTTTDDATSVINVDTTDVYELSAVANATEFTVTGTPTDGQKLIVRYKDAGVTKNLTWTFATAIGITLPVATTAGKWGYVGCVYNSAASQWHAIAVSTQA